ncbi:ATP-binding protein [Thermomonospora cellulosilytica]|uniref:Anti-sigma regulatory factor (Ser/Thr protein kinase) n=1 Tax=Thermomonospora cellulosilytica TaxID=1411118 RepID=A0A7W3R869_9ACTN|nr:ATP-binding protein [Thermomonospora cellulosilytica]MBA9003075.1 anti-sigma regulatory factor (Ser/Thr protein kinase) [Thermomonospora cellulosilytica]
MSPHLNKSDNPAVLHSPVSKGLPCLAERICMSVPPVAASVGIARAFVARRLTVIGRTDLVENGVLITSELVSNAVQALERSGLQIPVAVRIVMDGERPQIQVWDASEDVPVAHGSADLLAEGGRGLLLVDALAHSSGWRAERVGKTVFATL